MTDVDSANLEREAEAVRAQISDTTERLRAKMSAGQLMDEVLKQFQGGDASQMLVNIKDQARDNPMALALIGSGVAWLMFGSGTGGASAPDHGGTTFPRQDYPSAGFAGRQTIVAPTTGHGAEATTAGEAGKDVADDGPSLGERAAGAFSSAQAKAGGALGAAGDRASDMAGQLRATGAGALHDARDTIGSMQGRARGAFLDVLEREPLVIGAIGLAVGAAVGAMLPATELEREQMGGMARDLKEKAHSLVEKGMSEAKSTAAGAYEAARSEADTQGLTSPNQPIGAKLEAVARAAGDEIATSAERVTGSKHGSEDHPAAESAGSTIKRS